MPDQLYILAAPPLIKEFLRQIADFPQSGERLAFSYAASVILPETCWEPQEFLTRMVKELSLVHNQRILSRAKSAQISGTYSVFTFSLMDKTGVQRQFTATPRPGRNGVGEPVVLTALVAQPANPTSPFMAKEGLFSFLEVFPAYVLMIDREYSVRFHNNAARQLFGPVGNKKCYQLLHDRSEPCISCPPFGLFTDKAIKIHEWASPRVNTAFRTHSYPFEAEDGTVRVLQVGINITAGVRARHALDLSEQRYRSIAENLTIGLALVDADGALVTLNPKMEEWFGGKAVKGVSIEDLLQNKCCGSHEKGDVCTLKIALQERRTAERDFRLAIQPGMERSFRLVACPILTRTKQVRAIVVMLEDITDRQSLASRLQQVQRLEALGSLAGGIAHEINQPLSALHLYASGMQMLIEQGAVSPEQMLERLALILSQADKIRQIISHMRALVMQEENPPVSGVSVADAVKDALSLVGAQLYDHSIKVLVDIPDDLPEVSANAVQLEQVVINLLVNAMHALDSLPKEPEEGKQISVFVADIKPGTLILRVADNGPGVEGLHSKIFDPFFTTKDSHSGMGLGLSIVHAFVSSWGGSVEAGDNPKGRGAVFSVILPRRVSGEGQNKPQRLLVN